MAAGYLPNEPPSDYFWDIRMEQTDLINTFLSGLVIFKTGKEYVLMPPQSAEDKTFADFFSQEVYEDTLTDNIFTEEERLEFLIDKGYWNKEQDEQIELYSNNIENMKVDYFNNFFNSSTKKYIKTNISNMENKISQLYEKKYWLHEKTVEYLKIYAYTCFLIEKTAVTLNGQHAIEQFPLEILYNNYQTSIQKILSRCRETAKNPSWRSTWFNGKTTIFSNKLSTATDFQRIIMNWSVFYDSVHESMECPSDEVIEDDIALDGWSIKERRKRKEEKKKKDIDKSLPDKIANASEVFIPVKNQQEQNEILSLNDGYGKAKINSLKKDLKDGVNVDESDLTTTRQEIQMRANRGR